MIACFYNPVPVGGLFMVEPFGEFLRREREENDLTLQEVAERLEVSHATIQRYETGKRSVDYSVALQLADAIGVSRRRATEAWLLSNGGDKSLLAGIEVPEMESLPDEEYLQDSLMGYNGDNPILRAARRAALGEKALLDEAQELAKSAAEAESSGRVTGDEAHEVLVARPRKSITRVKGK